MFKEIQFAEKPKKYGGPSSFQIRLTKFLSKKNYEISYSNNKTKPDLLFIISGTRKYVWIMKNKIKGKKILQRLDGFLWKHKYENVSFFYKLKCEIMNLNMAFIRRFLADHVIYQSQYIKNEWDKKYGKKLKNFSIIHNAASDDFFYKQIKYEVTSNYKIICVEGVVQGDNLTISILKKLENLTKTHFKIDKVEVYGDNNFINKKIFDENLIEFKGQKSRDELSQIYNEPNLIFFVLEINPPCPNSLIESICAGVPSLGFDTGSYAELSRESGIAMHYNKKLNSLDIPNFDVIDIAVDKMINNYENCSRKSIEIADNYNIGKMGCDYLNIISRLIK